MLANCSGPSNKKAGKIEDPILSRDTFRPGQFRCISRFLKKFSNSRNASLDLLKARAYHLKQAFAGLHWRDPRVAGWERAASAWRRACG